jgi:hypothetical protein
MIIQEHVHSSEQPQLVQSTSERVFVASNITPYTITRGEYEETGYDYTLTTYTKDEYFTSVLTANQETINNLQQELAAAKILLGVE